MSHLIVKLSQRPATLANQITIKHTLAALFMAYLMAVSYAAIATPTLRFQNFGQTLQAEPLGTNDWLLSNGHRVYTNGSVIVKTAARITSEQLQDAYPWIAEAQLLFDAQRFRYFKLTPTGASLTQQRLDDLAITPDVLLVQPDMLQIRQPASVSPANTTREEVEAALASSGQTKNKPSANAGMNSIEPALSNAGPGSPFERYLRDLQLTPAERQSQGQGVRIAVIDDGFNLAHPLLSNVNLVFQYDVMHRALSSNTEDSQHGTAVLGVLFAQTPQLVKADLQKAYPLGLAPQAALIALAQTDTWTSHSLVQFQVAQLEQADIVNCSWNSLFLIEPVADAMNTLASEGRKGLGAAVVVAAGNEGLKLTPHSIEASVSSAITVGATNARGDPLPLSNSGPLVDIWTYGGSLPSAATKGGVAAFGGTSAAAAVVSGISARLLSVNPTLSLEGLLSRLQQTLPQPTDASNDRH